MKTIHKYPIGPYTTSLTLPEGARLLCVQVQLGTPCIWAEVETDNPLEKREIFVYGTGHKMKDYGTYVGTFQINEDGWNLVFHVYEGLSKT